MSTLAQLITITRTLIGDSTASLTEARARFREADIKTILQISEMKHFQDIVDASEDYFLVSYTFWVGPTYQTSGKDVYKLPTDCDRIRMIESVTNSGTRYYSVPLQDIPLNRASGNSTIYQFKERDYSARTAWTIVGQNIYFEPSFDSNEQLRIWYTKAPTTMTTSSDTPWGGTNDLSSQHHILAYDAAIQLLNSKEADTSYIQAQYERIRQNFISGISHRNASQPQTIRDAYYGE